MVSAVGARVQSKGSAKSRKPRLIPKRCPFCARHFHGAPQSTFCSKYCVEQACRRRKEALIEVFADLMFTRSHELTLSVYGVGFQITFDQARRKAAECIEQKHKPFKLKLEQLGYSYNETSKAWVLQARLPAPLIQ